MEKDHKLKVDPIKDHYFDQFQYDLTEIFDLISNQAFLILLFGSLWSGKGKLIFDNAFGSKVILFVSYLILAF